jgi:hypothetical protein
MISNNQTLYIFSLQSYIWWLIKKYFQSITALKAEKARVADLRLFKGTVAHCVLSRKERKDLNFLIFYVVPIFIGLGTRDIFSQLELF